MASAAVEALPRRSAEFVESSILEAIVPSATELDITEELRRWNGSTEDENSPLMPSVNQRQIVLFDERLPVYICFRTPALEDNTLKAYLSRLAIGLEAVAFSTAPPPEPEAKATPTKEVLYTGTIQNSDEPVIHRYGDDESGHTYVIWKTEVFISRPRGRFYKPAIYFQPSASLKPREPVKKTGVEDEYLPSGVPTAMNLLQPFENDPALAGTHPRLSALRISKIAPTAPVAKELVRPIRTGQRRLFRTLPGLIWRVRYSKAHASLSDPSLLASLDLEVAPIASYKMRVDDVEVVLRNGSVVPLVDHEQSISAVHSPGDQMTYLYKIRPDLNADGSLVTGSDGYHLIVRIKAKALISEECHPNISIDWRTKVDFSTDHSTNLLKAAHRLSNPSGQLSKPSNPDTLPQDTAGQQGGDSNDHPINVTLTITGPPRVQVGEVFYWDIFVVNRSDRSKKLAVLTIPKRKRDADKHQSHPSTSSAGGHRGSKKELLASAVVDENITYAKQKGARTDAAELLCLTTDVRIGHLAAGACYTAHLKFLALSAGVLAVDAVRIVDLATQEASDIRDLPAIVAVEKTL